MATMYDISVSIRRNGQEVFDVPLTARLTCDEYVGPAVYERATGGGYVALPTSVLDELQLLVVKADTAVTVRLDGQSDAGIVLHANGFLVVVNGDIDAGASTNATLDNSSGDTAVIQAFAAGT